MEEEKLPKGFEMKYNNLFLYKIEMWITLQCNLNWDWIEFKYIEWNLNSTKFNSNSIIGLRFNYVEFKFNHRKKGCKLVKNLFKIYLWICSWKKKLWKDTNLEKHLPMHFQLGMG